MKIILYANNFSQRRAQSVAKPRKNPWILIAICVCTEYIIRQYTQRVSTVQLHFLPCSRKGDPRRIRRRGSSRGSHISRSKSTMGFEAGQRMRAISVYSGRIVIYNGGEADVRLRGMNVPVAGYKSTVSLWQRRSSRISCATRVIPAGKRLGYVCQRTREQSRAASLRSLLTSQRHVTR